MGNAVKQMMLYIKTARDGVWDPASSRLDELESMNTLCLGRSTCFLSRRSDTILVSQMFHGLPETYCMTHR
jgi:hypothetical protein